MINFNNLKEKQLSPLFSILFFPCAIFYHEILLRVFDRDCVFFDMALVRTLFFSLSSGLLLFLILDLIPRKKIARCVGGLISFAFIAVLCVERGMKGTFGMYYGVMAAADTAGDAVGGFAKDAAAAFINVVPFILLALVPLLLFIILRGSIIREKSGSARERIAVIAALAAAQLFGVSLSVYGETKDIYTFDFSMNLGIPAFGLTNSMRLEFQYAIFGTPQMDMSSFIESDPGENTDLSGAASPTTLIGSTGDGDPAKGGGAAAPASPASTAPSGSSAYADTMASSAYSDSMASPADDSDSADSAKNDDTFSEKQGDASTVYADGAGSTGGAGSADITSPTGSAKSADGAGSSESETAEPAPLPRAYGPNIIDSIDFDALAEEADSKTLRSMHEYFGSLTPSMENEYTGLFAGKNLILICAESFDDYVIDPELTPTLYRMTQEEGFVFTNFYQPDWTLSTCGGEFSVTTGLIPNWIGKSDSARKAIGNAMPTTPGNIFRDAGYSVKAWHNGNYNYYSRDKYLPAFGYDYKAIGQGLELPTRTWLASDKEMIEATADEYINDYLQTGVPFHTYYMTISGHGAWRFSGNNWATSYRDLVEARHPGLSEPCLAYLAANIELDRALEVLVRKLEDAGIDDDTLIVMAADHYPYFLATGNNNVNDRTDYYNELNRCFGQPEDSEKDTSRYKNTLLMWSSSIPRTVVDAPCYSCDIVPTILNLFGMDYDSRLYTGRDILDPNYKADEYSSSMPLVIFVSNHGQGNSWITAAGTYEAARNTFTAIPGVNVPDDYVGRVNNLVAGKIRNSKLIITEDYYARVFK